MWLPVSFDSSSTYFASAVSCSNEHAAFNCYTCNAIGMWKSVLLASQLCCFTQCQWKFSGDFLAIQCILNSVQQYTTPQGSYKDVCHKQTKNSSVQAHPCTTIQCNPFKFKIQQSWGYQKPHPNKICLHKSMLTSTMRVWHRVLGFSLFWAQFILKFPWKESHCIKI